MHHHRFRNSCDRECFSDNRTPRYPALIILIGVVMVGYAISERPGAFTFEALPDVFMRVIGQYIG